MKIRVKWAKPPEGVSLPPKGKVIPWWNGQYFERAQRWFWHFYWVTK